MWNLSVSWLANNLQFLNWCSVSFLPPCQVKAAFTRAYNKEAHLTPYSLSSVKASKRQSGSAATLDLSEDLHMEETQSDEEEQDTLDSDAMIKVI